MIQKVEKSKIKKMPRLLRGQKKKPKLLKRRLKLKRKKKRQIQNRFQPGSLVPEEVLKKRRLLLSYRPTILSYQNNGKIK